VPPWKADTILEKDIFWKGVCFGGSQFLDGVHISEAFDSLERVNNPEVMRSKGRKMLQVTTSCCACPRQIQQDVVGCDSSVANHWRESKQWFQQLLTAGTLMSWNT